MRAPSQGVISAILSVTKRDHQRSNRCARCRLARLRRQRPKGRQYHPRMRVEDLSVWTVVAQLILVDQQALPQQMHVPYAAGQSSSYIVQTIGPDAPCMAGPVEADFLGFLPA